MKVVCLDKATYAADMDLHRPAFDHEWVEYERTAPDQILERMAGADVCITNKVPMRAETLDKLPDLKMISVSATGYDVIDIPACKARGIVVSNVRGYAENTVPEHTFALILALRRGIVGYRQDVIDGVWQQWNQFTIHTHMIRDLSGSTLGIIGEGVIGQGVARIAAGFGMKTMFAAHKGVDGLGPLYTPFEQVLEESDIITMHCPLNAHTRDTLGAAEFARMKRKPLIINTSRGGLVSEAAVVDALEAGQISGIGFDVFTKEPIAADNPLLRVIERPDVILTPHVAWASREAQTECWRQTIANIENFAAGKPTNTLT
ncbi:MAG: D-2-hydroxyacid dehydrogenase [Rhodobiaceae bacterium]|nr:D-2-hydroxyacid dehydrogenase [Rhodobiaceae bacterium]